MKTAKPVLTYLTKFCLDKAKTLLKRDDFRSGPVIWTVSVGVGENNDHFICWPCITNTYDHSKFQAVSAAGGEELPSCTVGSAVVTLWFDMNAKGIGNGKLVGKCAGILNLLWHGGGVWLPMFINCLNHDVLLMRDLYEEFPIIEHKKWPQNVSILILPY